MKSRKKQRIAVIIVVGFFLLGIIGITNNWKISYASSTSNLTTEQKAIQEIANAYYNREENAQYCSYRKSYLYAPEEATKQHTIYSVCSDFTYSVYYQAFGMKIQDTTAKIIEYDLEYYDKYNIKTNDVVEFWQRKLDDNGNATYFDNKGNQKEIDLTTSTKRQNYVQELLTKLNLQVGDILCYRNSDNTAGHALLVYDILYDNNGNPIDAVIRESNSKYETKSTKVTKGFSYAELKNNITGKTEGTFQELYLSKSYQRNENSTRTPVMNQVSKASYFTVLRPLLKDEKGNYTGKYYYAEGKTDSSTPFAYKIEDRTLKSYQLNDITKNRLKYNSIYIEKTVNAFNNSMVSLKDTIEYTIYVKNNSDTKYEGFDIMENISEYVNVVTSSNGTIKKNTITWHIDELKAGESIAIKYKVKAKNQPDVLGKKIISTGTVAGIPSATIKNTITSNLDSIEKDALTKKAENLFSQKTYKNKELITQIYQDSLGFSLDFTNFDITKLVVTRAGTQYYPENYPTTSTIYLNTANDYSNYLVNGYYGAVYTNSSNQVYQKFYENASSTIAGRSDRESTVYKENFQTGDVLVYQNTQVNNSNVTYETESGTFYLLYISEDNAITINGKTYSGFIGIDEEGNLKHISTEFTQMRTLLGKDYYTVFRPSSYMASIRELEIEKIEVTKLPNKMGYIQNSDTLNVTGGELTVTYSNQTTSIIDLSNSNVTISGFNNSKIGPCTLTVEYAGNKTTFTVDITKKEVEKIEITQNPTKQKYIQNYDLLNVSDGILNITYKDTSTEQIKLNDRTITISGFDNKKVGKQNLTVRYGGVFTTLEVEILTNKIKSTKVITPPKQQYISSINDIDLSGGKIEITYEDERKEEINLTDENISIVKINQDKTGENQLILQFRGEEFAINLNQLSMNLVNVGNTGKSIWINSIVGIILILMGTAIFIYVKKKKQS